MQDEWSETCFVSRRSVGRPSTTNVVVVAVEVGVAAVAVDSTKFISSSGILSVSPSHYAKQKSGYHTLRSKHIDNKRKGVRKKIRKGKFTLELHEL